MSIRRLLPLLLAIAAATATAIRPIQNKHVEELNTCYETDNDELETCLLDFWNNVKTQLIAGIPNLKLVPLDPMKVDLIEFEDEGTLVQTKSKFTDVEVVGAGEYEATSVKVDRKSSTVTLVLFIPSLHAKGLYDINGVVMLLPVHGKGHFTLNLTDVEGKVVSHMVPHGSGVKADSITVDFNVGSMKASLKGIPNDNGDASIVDEALNDMINTNGKSLMEDVKPKISQRLSETIMSFAGNAYVQISPKAFIE